MLKKCEFCGKEFRHTSYSRRYCNITCRKIAEQQRNRKLNKGRRVCKKCGLKKTSSSYSWYCNDCRKIVLKEYDKNKLIWQRQYQKGYYENIKDSEDYKKKRNERFKKYWRNRFDSDIQFKIAQRLRNLLYNALRQYTKKGKILSSRKYGIDYQKIIEQLKPFPKDVEGCHIDHIIPLSLFNLENPKEIKKAFAPENLQWLSSLENISKGKKLN